MQTTRSVPCVVKRDQAAARPSWAVLLDGEDGSVVPNYADAIGVSRGPELGGTTIYGELFVTGIYGHDERYCYVYRNAAWVEVAGPGGPIVQPNPPISCGEFGAACGWVLLG